MMFYALLGIPVTATLDEIKKAYRRRAAETHPDSVKGKEEEFKQVQLAYEVLSDEIKRAKYDRGEHWEDTSVDLVQSALGMIINGLRLNLSEGNSLRISVKNCKRLIQGGLLTHEENTRKVADGLIRVRKELTKLKSKIKEQQYLTSCIVDFLDSEEKKLQLMADKLKEERKIYVKALEMLDSDKTIAELLKETEGTLFLRNGHFVEMKGWSTNA